MATSIRGASIHADIVTGTAACHPVLSSWLVTTPRSSTGVMLVNSRLGELVSGLAQLVPPECRACKSSAVDDMCTFASSIVGIGEFS